MKKVFQTKLKNITKILALVIVASLATFMGCKSYDSDISQLNTDIVTLRTDLTTQMNNLNSATTTAVNAQIATLTTQLTADEVKLTALQTQLTALQASAATQAQITALQTQIDVLKATTVSQAASIAALQAYQATATAQILLLQTQVAAAAKPADLTALQTSVNAQILTVTTGLNNLGVTVTTLDGKVTTMNGTLTTAVSDLATLKGKVDAQLALITGLQNTVAALQNTTTTQLTALQTQLTSLQTQLTALQASAATQAQVTALQSQIDAVKASIASQTASIAALQTAMTSQGTSITTIQTQLASQLATITAHTADITKLQKDLTALQTSVATLQTKVNQNTTDIAANTAAIAALNTNLTSVTANFKVLANAINLNFEALSSRLTSLVFIPQLHVSGIPSMNFSVISYYPCTSTTPTIITPKYRVSYHVNPSFITKADIDFNNLGFVVNKSINIVTRYLAPATADTRVKATYVGLDAGILTVDVAVLDFEALLGTVGGNVNTRIDSITTIEKFSMIALQVPLSDKAVAENKLVFDDPTNTVTVGAATYPATRVVTSDYARLYYVKMTAPNTIPVPYNVYLVKKMVPVTSSLELSSTVAAAENLAVIGVDNGLGLGVALATDPLVITLPYGKSINLADSIGAYSPLISDLLTFERYGLSFQFDLKNADGSTIVYNRGLNNTTDQQKFILINDPATGNISAKVFDQTQIDAAQGRTPIVRVRVFNINNATCPVFTAWVKVLIADKPSLTPVTIPFIFGPNTDPDCSVVRGTITVQQMNELIYNRVGMSKTAFYATYTTFTASGEYSSLVQVPDAQQTDSYVINWDLASQYIWDKLFTATGGTYTFTAKATYKSLVPSVNPDVVITFTRTITRSTLDIAAASLITNYWYGNYTYVKHNIVVPFVGETATVGANSIANNINQAFEQTSIKSLKVMGSNNYKYFFTTAQPAISNGTTNVTLVPSADGQSLHAVSATGELVATINPFASGTGDVLVLNQSSATAKLLLNVNSENLKARLGIRTTWCNTVINPVTSLPYVRPVTINGKDYFDVVFVRPISPQPASNQHFVDALNLGMRYTYIAVDSLTNLNDWRFPDPVASFNGDLTTTPIIPAHPNYYSYYGVTNISVDAAHITTDLNQTGTTKVLLFPTYPDVRVAWVSSLTGAPYDVYGYLTYQNTGNTLGKPFNLYVPVTITYAWGSIQSTMVTVPVWKTVGQSGVKRK